MLSFLKSVVWGQSSGAEDTAAHGDEAAVDRVGFQVMYVRPDSPAHLAGLLPVFDYIVAANGTIFFKTDDNSFVELVQASAGKPVTLQLYNALTDAFRETTLVPAAAPDGSGAGCAGVVVRHARFDEAPGLVWHVGDVKPGSPAQHAGLAPDTDYIVGSPQVVFAHENDFFQYVAENIGVPLALFVWSTVTGTVRVVCVTPTLWGGTGLLGCDIMCGALHRIPRPAVLPAFTLSPPTQPFTSTPAPVPETVSASAVPAIPVADIPVPVPVSPIAYVHTFVPAAPVPVPVPELAATAEAPTDATVQTSALLEASDD